MCDRNNQGVEPYSGSNANCSGNKERQHEGVSECHEHCDTNVVNEVDNDCTVSNVHSLQHSFEHSYESDDPLLISISSCSMCCKDHNNQCNTINRSGRNAISLLECKTKTNVEEDKRQAKVNNLLCVQNSNVENGRNNYSSSTGCIHNDNTRVSCTENTLSACLSISSNAARDLELSPFHNWNVRLIILYNFCDGAAVSVWSAQLLSLLVYKWIDSTSIIGWAATLAGTSQIAGATIAAWMSKNSYSRQFIVRCAAGLLGCALVTYILSILCRSLFIVFLAQAMYGAYCGLASTSTEALFADSVYSGERTSVYNFKWMVQTLCYVVGYSLALIMLACWGNDWSEKNIRNAMLGGLLFHFTAIIWLCGVKDAYAVNSDALLQPSASTIIIVATDTIVEIREKEEEEPPKEEHFKNVTTSSKTFTEEKLEVEKMRQEQEEKEEHWMEENESKEHNDGRITVCTYAMPCTKEEENKSMCEMTKSCIHNVEEVEDEDADHNSHTHLLETGTSFINTDNPCTNNRFICTTVTTTINNDDNNDTSDDNLQSIEQSWRTRISIILKRCTSWSAVPFLVCLVDLLMAAGTGMILQYFPLFLVEEVLLTPSKLYMVYLISTICTSCVSLVVRFVADKWIGRLPAVMFTRLIGITSLWLMSQLKNNNSMSAMWLMVAFVARNSTMNAVMGITRSVIMDSVKKENRAKWSAFESFSSFTWAGSAMVGGYIAQAKSYQFAFAITAYIHYAATLVLIPAIIGAAPVERNLRQERRQVQQEQQQQWDEVNEEEQHQEHSC